MKNLKQVLQKQILKNKVKIALREARETNYWLRILKELNDNNDESLESLIKESQELKNILGAIVVKSNNK